MILVSAPESDANPFVFMFHWRENGPYQLIGEGTGDKAATDAAYNELNALSKSELDNIVAETKRAVQSSAPSLV